VSTDAARLAELGAGDVVLAPGVVETLRAAHAGAVIVVPAHWALEARVMELLDHGAVVNYRFVDRGEHTMWRRAFFAWAVVGAISLKDPEEPAPSSRGHLRPLN
jgi:hypothetical protein